MSETVRHLQGGDTDNDFADKWGVSAGTVANARNRNHDLSSVPLLKLGERFGPDALSTVLHLIGLKAIGQDEESYNPRDIPCDVAKCVPLLITLLGDGDCSNDDVHQLDEAGVIETLTQIADMLCQRRDRLRLRSVA